jgi:NADPH-dependent 2,4-dienoyl-CoA reductase/sulfur reductase-like enzyme
MADLRNIVSHIRKIISGALTGRVTQWHAGFCGAARPSYIDANDCQNPGGTVMAETRHTKVLIIGSGPAGYTAAVYASRAMLSRSWCRASSPAAS